jgi:hypothetical protein
MRAAHTSNFFISFSVSTSSEAATTSGCLTLFCPSLISTLSSAEVRIQLLLHAANVPDDKFVGKLRFSCSEVVALATALEAAELRQTVRMQRKLITVRQVRGRARTADEIYAPGLIIAIC